MTISSSAEAGASDCCAWTTPEAKLVAASAVVASTVRQTRMGCAICGCSFRAGPVDSDLAAPSVAQMQHYLVTRGLLRSVRYGDKHQRIRHLTKESSRSQSLGNERIEICI